MELKQYLKVVKKQIGLTIFFTILVTILAFLFSYFRPVSYESSISFAVNRINREATDEYQYDGYYAIQASDLVSQTVVSWFSTPSVVLEIYNTAKVTPEFDSMEGFATLFNTKKSSSQNIMVKFNEKDESTANDISQATIRVISSKVAELNKNSDAKALFEIVASPPVILEKKPNLVLNTVIGFIVGLTFSLFIGYAIYYFREEKIEQTQ